MLTVLIAEQKYIDTIKTENRLFFEPLLDNRDLVFCAWNPEGQTLKESVPGLQGTVGRTKEWRAVVLHSCSDRQKTKQNPFDEVDYRSVLEIPVPNSQPGDEWDRWETEWENYYSALSKAKEQVFKNAFAQPLTRLGTWLCFRPQDYVLKNVVEKKDVQDWAMDEIGDNRKKPSSRLERMENEEYRLEIRMKENIRREFIEDRSINIAYPSEVYCISERITEHGFFDPEAYWATHSIYEYSQFADRNMYFDRMRFLVFDMLPETHSDCRNDQIRFMASVLIFASNPIPSSAVQARNLYVLESENDETSLRTIVSSFDQKLAATSEVIQNEIDRIRSEIPGELTDKQAALLFLTPADVPVKMDEEFDPDALHVDMKTGLSSDCPENEKDVWASSRRAVEKELAYVVKQQERSVRKSVGKMKGLSEVSETNISRLNAFQLEDVQEHADLSEDDMLESVPPDFSNFDYYEKKMEECERELKEVMERRMKSKTTVILGVVLLAMFLICFLPLLINNAANAVTVPTALTMIGIMLGLIVIVMIITLFFLRIPMRTALRSFNNGMLDILHDIQKAMSRFSKYLSSVCNVRRSYKILDYAKNHPDPYSRSIQIRKEHQADILEMRAILKEQYNDYLYDSEYLDEVMIRPYEYDFGVQKEYRYPAPYLGGDARQIEFLISGNYVTVPSSFVKRITIRLEEMYDG